MVRQQIIQNYKWENQERRGKKASKKRGMADSPLNSNSIRLQRYLKKALEIGVDKQGLAEKAGKQSQSITIRL